MTRMPLEKAVEDAGLKKKFVAQKLGIDETYISRYLKQADKISVKNALILCSLTGKKLNELDFGQPQS